MTTYTNKHTDYSPLISHAYYYPTCLCPQNYH